MKKQKEITLLICAFLGGIADFIAIIMAVKSFETALPFFVIAFLLLVWSIMYIYTKYRERCEFIDFIEYLFDNPTHNFNLLPKICLALDKSKEVNPFLIKELEIKYTYDMRNIDAEKLSESDLIYYSDTIEYNFCAENNNIPKEFICYRGNMKADDSIEIMQKHGCQTMYENVPEPRYTDETRADVVVQRYSWQLKKENITKGKTFPLSFIFKYKECAKANSDDTIIIYPKQYAKKVDNINCTIKFLCTKDALKRVELYRVWKDGRVFKHTPVTGVTLQHNIATIQIQPDTTKCEAYYIRLYWELV